MTLILPSTKISPADTLFLFRASDCIDEEGIFARSYGRRLGGAFSRGSRKVVADSRGALVRLPNGAPPLSWLNGEPVMLLEPARTNLCLRSEEFDNASWVAASATVTPNTTIAPDGLLTADTLDVTSTGGGIYQVITFTGDGEKCAAIYLKRGTSTKTRLTIRDQTAAANRHVVDVTWGASLPTLTTIAGAGTLYPVGTLASGWYRILFSATGIIAANVHRFLITDNETVTGTVLVWGAEAEDAVVPSSYIKTEGSTVTRNADSLYFPIGFGPRALTVYVRGVSREIGTNTGIGRVNLVIGSSNPAADPRFILYGTGAGNIGGEYDDGTTIRASAPLPSPLAAVGSLVEQRATLSASGFFQAGVSIAGGAEVLGSSNGPNTFPANWNQARIYLTGGLTSLNTQHAYTHVVVAEGVKTMDEMRALAGV